MDDFIDVPCVISIRRNSDGLVREIKDLNWHGSDYIWCDGNFACDCNRYLFFQRAANEDDEEEHDCGDSAYTVLSIKLDDGTVVYKEDDDATI